MGDDGIAGPPAKKRGATRQISKDDGSDSERESFVPAVSGSFQKAPEEVIASRRIVKVRRTPVAQGPPAPNPFASIRLVATTTSGVPPVPLSSATSLVPPVEPLEEAAGVKDPVTISVSTDAEHLDEVQEGTGEVEAAGESVDAPRADTHGSTDAVEEQGMENGESKLEMPKSPKVEDDTKKDVVSGEVDVKSEVDIGSIASESASASTVEKGLEAGNSSESLVDNKVMEDLKSHGGKQDTDLGASEQGDAAKGDTLVTKSTFDGKGMRKDTLPPLGTAISGSFSFGTTPSSFETPTAFASFSSTWAAFGSGTASGTSTGSGFGFSKAASEGVFALASSPFGNSNGSSFQLFNTQSSSAPLSSGPPVPPPASAMQFQGGNTPTGEEQEKMVFGSDATLFEFADAAWKERGKGELRINVPLDKAGKARLLMRSKGNFRLILNASLFPDMKMTSMDSRGVTFACINSAVEEKSGLVTYALKFKDSLAANNFRDSVETHKSPPQESLKTPENSPSSLHGP